MRGCTSMKDFVYEDHIGLWANELRDFVPDTVIDTHEHIGPESIVGPLDEVRKKSALTTYIGLEWEELQKLYADMYEGMTVKYTCAFGFVIHELDVRKANSYVLQKAKEDPRLLPLLLFSPRDPDALRIGYEEAQQLGVKVYGVKPYFDFADKPGHFTAMDVELEDFVSEEMLEFCNDHDMIFILHTCGIGMGDPALRAKIEAIFEKYPRIKLILAHMGRFYFKEQFFDFVNSGFMEKHKDKDFWFDVSSVTDEDVFDCIFKHKEFFPRLLYAQDQPFGLIPGIEMYSELRGGIFLTRDEYDWSDPEMLAAFPEERKKLTYNNYHCIKSIKDAMEANIKDKDELEKVKLDLFYNNAAKLLGVD